MAWGGYAKQTGCDDHQFPTPVLVFGRAKDNACIRLLPLYRAARIPFEWRGIDDRANAAEMWRLVKASPSYAGGAIGLPVVWVNGKVLVRPRAVDVCAASDIAPRLHHQLAALHQSLLWRILSCLSPRAALGCSHVSRTLRAAGGDERLWRQYLHRELNKLHGHIERGATWATDVAADVAEFIGAADSSDDPDAPPWRAAFRQTVFQNARKWHQKPGQSSSSFAITNHVRFRPYTTAAEAGVRRWYDARACACEVRAKEAGAGGKACIFHFASVLSPAATQADVFDSAAAPVVQAVLNGRPGTIFCYGQTGSGKTFSMFGSDAVLKGDSMGVSQCDQGAGMVPRACRRLLEAAQADVTTDYHFTVQFVEIYRNSIFDLLALWSGPGHEPAAGSPRHGCPVAIAANLTGWRVGDLVDVRVSSRRAGESYASIGYKAARVVSLELSDEHDVTVGVVFLKVAESRRTADSRSSRPGNTNLSRSTKTSKRTGKKDGGGDGASRVVFVPHVDVSATVILGDAVTADISAPQKRRKRRLRQGNQPDRQANESSRPRVTIRGEVVMLSRTGNGGQCAVRDKHGKVHSKIGRFDVRPSRAENVFAAARRREDDRRDGPRLESDGNTGFRLANVKSTQLESLADVAAVLRCGQAAKHVYATNANTRSSRSHCLFLLSVAQTHRRTGKQLSSRLNLVDLAGSERVAKTKCAGERLSEAKDINSSLLSLQKCIKALLSGSSHAPFRDAKLTMLLKHALTAQSGATAMVVTCASDESEHRESLSTLRFGEQAGMLAAALQARAARTQSRIARVKAQQRQCSAATRGAEHLVQSAFAHTMRPRPRHHVPCWAGICGPSPGAAGALTLCRAPSAHAPGRLFVAALRKAAGEAATQVPLLELQEGLSRMAKQRCLLCAASKARCTCTVQDRARVDAWLPAQRTASTIVLAGVAQGLVELLQQKRKRRRAGGNEGCGGGECTCKSAAACTCAVLRSWPCVVGDMQCAARGRCTEEAMRRHVRELRRVLPTTS